ncbi:uncharacterized protein LOC143025925 [Oratosquilla oratoria]|uniref:uncharacterized protein LOC143025925 n=1 Tax=Oratosquilla oratoria TaxID=337810 RepID=UPI003F7668EE
MRTSIFLFFFLVAVLKTGEALSHETTPTSTSTTSSTSTTTPTTTSTSTTTPTSTSTTSSTSTTTPTTTSTSTTTPTSTSTTSTTSTTTPTTTSTSTTTPTSTSSTSSTSTTTPTTCSPIDTTNVEPDLGQIESGIDTIEGIVDSSVFTADQGSLVQDRTQTITDQVTRLRTLLSAGQTSDVMADIEYKVGRALAQVGNANNRITVAEENDALRSEYVTRTDNILQKTIKRLDECINLLEPMNCPLPTTTTTTTTTAVTCSPIDSTNVDPHLNEIESGIDDIEGIVDSSDFTADQRSLVEDRTQTITDQVTRLRTLLSGGQTSDVMADIQFKVSRALVQVGNANNRITVAEENDAQRSEYVTRTDSILEKTMKRLNECIKLLEPMNCPLPTTITTRM